MRNITFAVLATIFCMFITVCSSVSFASPEVLIPKPLTPAWIQDQLKSHGAKSLVNLLWNHSRYNEVMDQIASGKSEWIELAPQLAPGTDAGTSEELGISLAFALPKNPKAVLSVLAPGAPPISLESVCGVPSGESHEFYAVIMSNRKSSSQAAA